MSLGAAFCGVWIWAAENREKVEEAWATSAAEPASPKPEGSLSRARATLSESRFGGMTSSHELTVGSWPNGVLRDNDAALSNMKDRQPASP
jgi:hypothetical protein